MEKVESRQGIGIRCRGTKILICLSVIYFGFKVFAGVAMAVYVGVQGSGAVTAALADGEWRLSLTFMDGIYNTFPAEWGYGVTAIENPVLCMIVVTIAYMISWDLPILAIFLLICTILRQMKDGRSPFVLKTANAVRAIGIILVCMGVCSKLILQVSISVIVFGGFHVENPWDLTYIVAGLLILVIEKIFRYGCELQEEADTTI